MKDEENKIISGMFWHCHHNVLCGWVYDYQKRVDYIKNHKPKNEIKTRLKLFKKVKGKLPEEFVEAEKKCVEAWKKYDKAKKKFIEAEKNRNKSRKKYAPEIEKLHKKECGCKEWKNGQINFLGVEK